MCQKNLLCLNNSKVANDHKIIRLVKMRNRYSRQIAIPEFGKEGQLKLEKARVLVIGCGALGSMVAMQLAGAGVKYIGIADYDTIDVSNLQRQFFFHTEEAGLPKAEILKLRMKSLNPEIDVLVYKEMITISKAENIFDEYDFIIDATDNPDSKRMTGEISSQKKKSCCIGGVRDFSGQVLTLKYSDARFEDYFGQVSSQGFLPCSLGGVIGPAAALCASVQTSEAIKYITGIGNLLSGKLFIFNLLTNSFKTFNL